MKHKLTSVVHVRGSIQNGRSTAMAAMARGMRPGIEGKVLWLCPTHDWKKDQSWRYGFNDYPHIDVEILNKDNLDKIFDSLSKYHVVIIDHSELFEQRFIKAITHTWSFNPGLMGLMFVVH